MSKAKVWIRAFRLRTLPLAFSCILMGAFLAAKTHELDGWVLGLCLLTTLFLQILSNLANDYGDAVSGVDSEQRKGPDRVVSSGLITKKDMKVALVVFVCFSLISGIGLIAYVFQEDWVTAFIFLMIGIGAIAAAIKYTVGQRPYGYAGYGDLFVMVFFGLVGVGGSYYLHTLQIDYLVLLPAYSCGAFAVGVLNVNNIRDIESDRSAGKYSIPVRLGRSKAVFYHWLLLASGVLTMVVYMVLSDSRLIEYVFLVTLPLFISNARAVKVLKTPGQLDPYLRQLAIATLVFVLLFGMGQIPF